MNVSMSEIIVILLVALLVIKPEQLPDVAFSLGRFIQYIRHSFGKVKMEMNDFMTESRTFAQDNVDPEISKVKEKKRD